jgi:hypothetical protein
MRPLRQLADIAFSLRMIIGVLETASIRDPQVRPPLHENFEAPFSLTLSVHCESNLFNHEQFIIIAIVVLLFLFILRSPIAIASLSPQQTKLKIVIVIVLIVTSRRRLRQMDGDET